MHEGKRAPSDYVEMAAGMGDFALATHSWHMCERRGRGIMDASEERSNAARVREVLAGILDLGLVPETIGRGPAL